MGIAAGNADLRAGLGTSKTAEDFPSTVSPPSALPLPRRANVHAWRQKGHFGVRGAGLEGRGGKSCGEWALVSRPGEGPGGPQELESWGGTVRPSKASDESCLSGVSAPLPIGALPKGHLRVQRSLLRAHRHFARDP